MERTHEFVSAGSEIDPVAPLYPFRQKYGIARTGKVTHRDPWPDSSLLEDEPRPGMDEVEGSFYDAANDPHEIKNKLYGEYASHNYQFWGFMFGALAISVMLLATVRIGISDLQFKLMEEPNFSPPNELVIAGMIVFYFLTAYVVYHNWKQRNGPTYRRATLFFMIVTWALTLWWAVVFYAQHSPRDSNVILFLAMISLIIWIVIVMNRGKYDQSRIWLLLLGLVWLVYLFYYNIGVVKLLPKIQREVLEKCVCECFGDPDFRNNRFERAARHTIV